jgi:septal ring factor EnvC (AmiA/AmiB activator)
MMILTQPLDKTFDVAEDINLGIVNNVKRIMDTMLTNLQRKNSEEINGVKAEITRVQAEITRVEQEIKQEIKTDMKSLEEKMNQLISMMSEKQSS